MKCAGICSVLALAAATGLAGRADAGAFLSGNNLVVVRLGDGSAPLGSAAASVFLDEYDVSGVTPSLVKTVALPASGSSALTMSALSGGHDGLLNRSTDGRYLTLTGYRYDSTGASDPATLSSAAGSVPRVIGRVAFDGSVNTSTTITDAYDSLIIRGAASTDGAHFWVAGDGQSAADAHKDGLRYIGGVGGTTSVDLDLIKPDATTPPYVNTRSVSIFSNQLYATSGSGSSIGKNAFKAGAGLQTSGPTQLTGLEPAGAVDSTNAMFLADLDGTAGIDPLSATGGEDTLYATWGGALRKYSYVGGAWVASGLVATGGEALTASVVGNTVTLYETNATTINRVVDSSGYNAALSGSATAYITVGADQQFRGVALAPVPEPATLGVLGLSGAGLLIRRRRR